MYINPNKANYIVSWNENLPNLLKVIAHTIKSLSNQKVNVEKSAFIIPHETWVDAGFSGCSTPPHILLDHTNANVGSCLLSGVELLKEEVEHWEESLPDYVHYQVWHLGSDTNLCGTNYGEVTEEVSKVTCPCCVHEILSKTTFNISH